MANNIVGIIIAVLVIGAIIYYYASPKTVFHGTIISKDITGSNTPVFMVTMSLDNGSTLSAVLSTQVVGTNRNKYNPVWNSLAVGGTYTFECTNMLGTWNCETK